MKRKTFTILFYPKRTKLLKNGEASIFMRITVDAIREEIAIKRSIKPDDWDTVKNRAKPTNPANRELNHYMESIRHRLYAIQRDLEDEGKTVTAELLKNRFLGINESNIALVELYREHNRKIRELIGKGYTKTTITRHETSVKHISDFIRYKYGKDDILLKDITPDFIKEYEHYLRTVRECNNNTAVKYIRNMGKILNWAEQKDIIKRNPMSRLKFNVEEVDKIFLTDTELKGLLQKEFPSDKLSKIRDVFVFCCMTEIFCFAISGWRSFLIQKR